MKKILLLGLLALVGYGLFGVAAFYIGKSMDYWKNPWAYSRDEKAVLLIGKWGGSFKDPDGIMKDIKMEILVPETDSERWARAFKKKKRRFVNRGKNFDGPVIVSSKLGTEYYSISGKVNQDDNHKIYLNFHTDEKKKKVLPNFILSESSDGKWESNTMTFFASFSYFKANGTSLYESSNSKHQMKIKVNLQRVQL